jgi:hypothetical protein
LRIATKLHEAEVFMNRNDWFVPLLAAVFGAMSVLGGSLVTGYQHERAAARQLQLAWVTQQAEDRAIERAAFKQAGLQYMMAIDAMVNNLVFAQARDKAVLEHLAHVQSAGHELALMANDELAQQTMRLNQTLASLLVSNAQPMEQRLGEINVQVVGWIKQFKRSLDALKAQQDESLSLKASTQTVAQLKR